MTPRERLITAFGRATPDRIPTAEIVFDLYTPLLGTDLILGRALSELSGREKVQALNHNIDTSIKGAEKLDHAWITVHPAPTPWYLPESGFYPSLEDECYVVKNLFQEIGSSRMVAAGVDGTFAIPDGKDFLSFAYAMEDDAEDLLLRAEKSAAAANEINLRLIDAGAEVIFLCSDYCFNQGPFLSPESFERFIVPFLKSEIDTVRKAGGFIVKHTDGNIIPILDLLIEAGPDCIHSIDPIAGVDIAEVRKKTSLCLMGNVDVRYLEQGPVEKIRESAEYAIRYGNSGGGYIFSTCNSVFKGIPLPHYFEMLTVLKERGVFQDKD